MLLVFEIIRDVLFDLASSIAHIIFDLLFAMIFAMFNMAEVLREKLIDLVGDHYHMIILLFIINDIRIQCNQQGRRLTITALSGIFLGYIAETFEFLVKLLLLIVYTPLGLARQDTIDAAVTAKVEIELERVRREVREELEESIAAALESQRNQDLLERISDLEGGRSRDADWIRQLQSNFKSCNTAREKAEGEAQEMRGLREELSRRPSPGPLRQQPPTPISSPPPPPPPPPPPYASQAMQTEPEPPAEMPTQPPQPSSSPSPPPSVLLPPLSLSIAITPPVSQAEREEIREEARQEAFSEYKALLNKEREEYTAFCNKQVAEKVGGYRSACTKKLAEKTKVIRGLEEENKKLTEELEDTKGELDYIMECSQAKTFALHGTTSVKNLDQDGKEDFVRDPQGQTDTTIPPASATSSSAAPGPSTTVSAAAPAAPPNLASVLAALAASVTLPTANPPAGPVTTGAQQPAAPVNPSSDAGSAAAQAATTSSAPNNDVDMADA